MAIRTILLGVDGSRHAALAARWAAELAAGLGAEVVAVHAMGLLEDRGDGTMVPAEQIRDEVAVRLEQEWCEPCRAAGVPFRAEIVPGNPVTALLEAARRANADLIVVGTRGLGVYSGLHLGSTSHQVALYAHRPVVIVPAENAEGAGDG